MIPTGPDFVAIALQIGIYLREIGPFILFGAVAAAAQVTIFGQRQGAWSGDRLIAPIAALPLGAAAVFSSVARSFLIANASAPQPDESASRPGTVKRAIAYAEDLIFPFLASAAIGGLIVVLTPTEPLWTLLSADGPWRFLIAPLVAGALKPRGGSELPLVLAMITKGLDPAGMVAAIAGAGYRHANSIPAAVAMLGFGAMSGAILWATGIL
jgi:uncharacterized membrane protein YraQ (UPF0718 family)